MRDNHQPEIQTAAVVVTFSRGAKDTLLDLPLDVPGHRYQWLWKRSAVLKPL